MKAKQAKDELRKIKTSIQRIDIDKKLKFAFSALWLLLLVVFSISRIGRTFIVLFGYILFILFISYAVYYGYLETKKAMKRREEASSNENVIVDDSYEVATDNNLETSDSNDFEVNDTTTSNGQSDIVIRNDERIYYLLETSTFFELDKYTSERGYYISDIIYGGMPLNDAFSTLAEAIKTRRCYVTEEILREVIHAEQDGKLRRGVSEFIEEDIGIWSCQKLSPDEFEKLMSKEDIDNEKTYKPKYYNLVWNAVCLADIREGEVIIVTSNKKITSLARANQIEIVNPLEIKEE